MIVMVIVLALAFVGWCVALWVDASARYDAESHVELLRELSRLEHPSQDDWTPPHGMERP